MSQYSAFRCALSDLQNNEKRLISNDLRFCVVNPLKVAFAVLFHCLRHTFGVNMVTSGISMESVAKMMGHSNLRSTQVYAVITDDKISKDMDKLMQRRETKETDQNKNKEDGK